ncbi:MAG TPA: SDR family NAD(P)-dependent oxidoreductase [Bacteroidota bacterium]|nr:SDR family NAD(P)-dependent oxidoreductase [Bacteroidota bacterium]
MELTGSVAIITGAGGAIGRATALLLAQEGASVVLADLKKEGIEDAARRVKELGGKALAVPVDVAEEKDVLGLIRSTLQAFGPPDILVNNAAISLETPILDIKAADWDRVMAVNLRSVFLLSREAFRVMKERGRGKIISMASASAKIGGLVVGAHYAASKAGVICFTKSLALQAAPFGINVNAVCPGPTKTPMTDAWGERANAEFAAKIPFKRYGEPEEIAQAVLFLASARSRYITGEILDVNGGFIMD